MATQLLQMASMLVGGLAFFLYGMNAMSSGLEKMAGGGLERTMKKVSSNDILGFFLGAGVTIAIQSSSAMTVMLVGLVNSGIVLFRNTFGMIMGSNVGTTLTAWMLALTGNDESTSFFAVLLKPEVFAPILAFIGIAIRMLSKNEKKCNLGLIFIGFAILIYGMELMSDSMKLVRETEGFETFLATLSSPIIALLVSTVFTGVIQSSAATIAIVIALATPGDSGTAAITWQMAIPLVLGANIGTCVTSLVSSIGTNKSAKRVVILHFFVNTFGSLLCMAILYVMKWVGVDMLGAPTSGVGVAAIHTAFNLVTTVVLYPIRGFIMTICEKVVPDKEEKQHTAFLDERIFNNTPLAISECRRLANEMAEHTRTAIVTSLELIDNYNEEKAQLVKNTEFLTDKYEDKLGTYLVRLSSNNLSEEESHAISRMLHSLNDMERISDHALNISGTALEIKEKEIIFSDDAKREINIILSALDEIIKITIDSFINDDFNMASHVEPIEQVIDKLKDELKKRHIERLQKGECTVQLGFVFSDLLTNIERVSDHCSNIAVYTLQQDSPKLDTHKYLRKVRTSAVGNFIEEFENYEKKYSLD